MPELPEVEVTRRGLLDQIAGRRIIKTRWSAHRLRTAIPRQLLRQHITGQQLQTIDRRAKYLLFRMSTGAVLLLHLGMTGKLGLMRQEIARHKHDHLVLQLDNAMEVRFNDSRRFGSIAVWPASQSTRLEQEFSDCQGVEPFSPEFSPEFLHTFARKRQTPVKTLLMNASLVAGIGNIYANEILFAAGIHPLTPAANLSLPAWGKIVAASRIILQQAIDAGGSTISDFLGSSGHPGYFQLQFNVYGRKDAPCTQCAQRIVKTTQAGRATYHCPHCQPLA